MSAKCSTLEYALQAQTPSNAASAGSSSTSSRLRIVIRANRSVATEGLQDVAHAVHGADHEALALELAAQTMHVDFDRIVADSAVAIGERGRELRLLHDVTGALHQRREHVELALRQRECRAAQLRELAGINLQRTVDQRLLAAARA